MFMDLLLFSCIVSAEDVGVCHTPFRYDYTQLQGMLTCCSASSEVYDGSSHRNILSSIWVYHLKGKRRAVLPCYHSYTSSLFW